MAELRRNTELCQSKFDAERREWMRSIQTVEESKAQNAGSGKAEIDMLKAKVSELSAALADAERTRLFLLEDNGKIKQQKAKLRYFIAFVANCTNLSQEVMSLLYYYAFLHICKCKNAYCDNLWFPFAALLLPNVLMPHLVA
ncbi:unnamed protein product [Gongylonema pulchrum]|uniref:PH domain-containing protein n=1 Tax=Gongylonema pulchrum TaxID=637853 RepID=A0A183ETR9_9BILA|nr:unnamed protein product [Gongylonema pulchrum]